MTDHSRAFVHLTSAKNVSRYSEENHRRMTERDVTHLSGYVPPALCREGAKSQATPRETQFEHGCSRLHLSFLDLHTEHETGSCRLRSRLGSRGDACLFI